MKRNPKAELAAAAKQFNDLPEWVKNLFPRYKRKNS